MEPTHDHFMWLSFLTAWPPQRGRHSMAATAWQAVGLLAWQLRAPSGTVPANKVDAAWLF